MKNNKETTNNTICKLSELNLHQKGKVLGVHHDNFNFKIRLLSMGLTKGVIVEIIKQSPFKNPVSILFRSYELVLRKQDLKNILVEVIK